MIQTTFHDLLDRIEAHDEAAFSINKLVSVGDNEIRDAIALAIRIHEMRHPNEPALKPESIKVGLTGANRAVITLGYTKRFGPETPTHLLSCEYTVQLTQVNQYPYYQTPLAF